MLRLFCGRISMRDIGPMVAKVFAVSTTNSTNHKLTE